MRKNFHLLTRPVADSLAMQRKLQLLKVRTIINPLLKIIFHPEIIKEFFATEILGDCAVIVTSINSLRGLKSLELAIPKNLHFLITGEVSYQEALAMKFKNLQKIGEKSQDVLNYFSKERPKYRKIYHLSGDKITLNLEISLKKLGFSVERYVIYDSRPQIFTEETVSYFKKSKIGSVSLFSSYSAEVFCQEVEKYSLEREMMNLKLFTISEEIARIIRGKILNQKIFISDSYGSDDMTKLILEQHS